jgi:hypothetical protein
VRLWGTVKDITDLSISAASAEGLRSWVRRRCVGLATLRAAGFWFSAPTWRWCRHQRRWRRIGSIITSLAMHTVSWLSSCGGSQLMGPGNCGRPATIWPPLRVGAVRVRAFPLPLLASVRRVRVSRCSPWRSQRREEWWWGMIGFCHHLWWGHQSGQERANDILKYCGPPVPAEDWEELREAAFARGYRPQPKSQRYYPA